MTGTIIRVKNMELLRPPINAQARPFFHSEPAPWASAIGINPITMVMLVMRIGRNRNFVASIKASFNSIPFALKLFVKSTTRMAFLPSNPTSIIKPRMEKILKDCFASASASKAPIMAKGIEILKFW